MDPPVLIRFLSNRIRHAIIVPLSQFANVLQVIIHRHRISHASASDFEMREEKGDAAQKGDNELRPAL